MQLSNNYFVFCNFTAMLIKKSIIIFFVTLISIFKLQAQVSGFFDAITAIMHDSPNQFRNIRGKVINNSIYAITWECGIKVPGTIASRFVFAKGTYYEGALLQTTDIGDVKRGYQHYIAILDSFATTLGYTKSASDNFFPGMGEYKKIAYLPKISNNSKPEESPPHLALNVTYSKEKDIYTIELYIYEH